jgi:hypothetical protein
MRNEYILLFFNIGLKWVWIGHYFMLLSKCKRIFILRKNHVKKIRSLFFLSRYSTILTHFSPISVAENVRRYASGFFRKILIIPNTLSEIYGCMNNDHTYFSEFSAKARKFHILMHLPKYCRMGR